MVHDVYNQIDEYERLAVDDAMAAVVKTFKEHAIPLGTDDRIERVTEALAVAVSQSRPVAQRNNVLLLSDAELSQIVDHNNLTSADHIRTLASVIHIQALDGEWESIYTSKENARSIVHAIDIWDDDACESVHNDYSQSKLSYWIEDTPVVIEDNRLLRPANHLPLDILLKINPYNLPDAEVRGRLAEYERENWECPNGFRVLQVGSWNYDSDLASCIITLENSEGTATSSLCFAVRFEYGNRVEAVTAGRVDAPTQSNRYRPE